ncbi:MAG: hypothetical protein ACOX5Q_03335 [Bacillota bacterium]|jgi:hypothetical protein|nr:hypothetical protein [Candidatus Fermentithermobacillaceae bacterium]
MHVAIGTIALLIGIYTLSWAWSLAKRRMWAGVVWSVILALASTGLTFFYLIRHGFYP